MLFLVIVYFCLMYLVVNLCVYSLCALLYHYCRQLLPQNEDPSNEAEIARELIPSLRRFQDREIEEIIRTLQDTPNRNM